MAAPKPAEAEFPGTERFRVERRLGAGGMGVVYQALDLERQSRVALKTVRTPEALSLFRIKQEFRALADVTHPNLVTLYELSSVGEQCFFTMELVDGVDFLRYVRPPDATESDGVHADSTTEHVTLPVAAQVSSGVADDARYRPSTLNLPRLRATLAQLAAGVAALHEAGKLHRDLKPSNVLVTPEGRVVILDFGLVTELAQSTRHGERSITGTVAYMSPEQAARQPLGPASDWYAVGVMLFEALTGRRPFVGNSKDSLSERQEAEPAPPGRIVPDVPEDLDALCTALLRKDPEARPDAQEVLRRLGAPERARRGDSGSYRTVGPAALAGSTLVGRDAQLGALFDAYKQATTSARGPVVALLHGASGMGKSAVLQQFLDWLEAAGDVVVLAGRCYERESVPYKAVDGVVDALSQFLTALPGSRASALVPRNVHALTRVFPVLRRVKSMAAEAPGRSASPGGLGAGAPMGAQPPRSLGAQPASPSPASSGGGEVPDPHELRRRAFAALKELLGRLAERAPLVVCVDDVQWGDLDSVSLLASLLGPPDPPAALVVLSYRSEDIARSPVLAALYEWRGTAEAPRDVREVELGPLDEAQARALARSLLGAPPAPAPGPRAGPPSAALAATAQVAVQSEAIARESGGSPFFVSELVRYVQSGAWSASDDEATSVVPTGPPSGSGPRPVAGRRIELAQVLRARLDALPPDARSLLEVVALAAQPLGLALAAQVAGLTPEQQLGSSALLRNARLLRTGGASGPAGEHHDEVEPFHDRIREAAVGALPDARQRSWYARLATAMEQRPDADPEALAGYFRAAGQLPRAGELYAAAAERAEKALAFDRAAGLYRASLECLPDGEDRLAPRLGDALTNAGRGPDAAVVYLRAAQRAPPGGAEQLELRRKAAEQLLSSGHVDHGTAAVREVLAAVGMGYPATPRAALVSLIVRRAQVRLRGLGFREREARDIAPDELTRIDACWSVAVGLGMVDTIRGADFNARNLLLSLRAGEPYRIVRGLALEAAFAASSGGFRNPRVDRLIAAAQALARRTEHPHALGLSVFMPGIASFVTGRYPAALEACDRAADIFRERCTGVAWELNSAQLFANMSLYYLGRWGELARRVPPHLRQAQATGNLYAATTLRIGHSNAVWLWADEPSGALREVDDAMGRWSQQGFHMEHLLELIARVHVALYRGDGEAAFGLVCARWPALARSMLLRIQHSRITAWIFRASAALAAAPRSGDAARLLAVAAQDARRIEREKMPWGTPVASLFRAAVLVQRGGEAERDHAARLLDQAASGFDAASMGLYASVARYRLGQIMRDGALGKTLQAGALRAMASDGIRNPPAVADVLAPGFGVKALGSPQL